MSKNRKAKSSGSNGAQAPVVEAPPAPVVEAPPAPVVEAPPAQAPVVELAPSNGAHKRAPIGWFIRQNPAGGYVGIWAPGGGIWAPLPEVFATRELAYAACKATGNVRPVDIAKREARAAAQAAKLAPAPAPSSNGDSATSDSATATQ